MKTIDAMKRAVEAMEKGYMGRNHAEYCAAIDYLKIVIAREESQTVEPDLLSVLQEVEALGFLPPSLLKKVRATIAKSAPTHKPALSVERGGLIARLRDNTARHSIKDCVLCNKAADMLAADAQPKYVTCQTYGHVVGACAECNTHEEAQQVAVPQGVPPLGDDELQALHRFAETCDDGQAYDVPKEMMQRLAKIGVIRRVTASIYETTSLGDAILAAPQPPQAERVPMTDSEIVKIAQDNVAAEPGRDGYILPISFARAVEAHHGIKP